MNEFKNKPTRPRWYNRGIGIFCGGFLGFCFTAIFAMFFGDLAVLHVAILLAAGLTTGMLTGYLFPHATETLWWIFSIFN